MQNESIYMSSNSDKKTFEKKISHVSFQLINEI